MKYDSNLKIPFPRWEELHSTSEAVYDLATKDIFSGHVNSLLLQKQNIIFSEVFDDFIRRGNILAYETRTSKFGSENFDEVSIS